MEYECRMKGCLRLAYPPVVANGISNNTLHYINNDSLLGSGSLILMDAGGEYHGYNSDITRTWPVNGKYSPEQAIVYNAVLHIQEQCISEINSALSSGISMSLNNIHVLSCRLVLQALVDLGICTSKKQAEKLYQIFYPHSIGHWLGMELHDTPTVRGDVILEPGMTFTLEPGLYLPDSREVPEKFRGIGVRIEDDVLVTTVTNGNKSSIGLEILTKEVPKKISDVENTII